MGQFDIIVEDKPRPYTPATATMPAPYTPAPPPPSGIQQLYDDWKRSGLSLEEYGARLQSAVQQPYTPAPEPDVVSLQRAAFVTPPEPEPEVVTMQREAFNYSPAQAQLATQGQVVTPFGIPDIGYGTPEGNAAIEEIMRSVLPVENVPTRERLKEWSDQQALAEGYKKMDTDLGTYWEKGKPSEPSMMDKIGGVVGPIVKAAGALADTNPLTRSVVDLFQAGVPQQVAGTVAQEALLPAYETFQNQGTEPLGWRVAQTMRAAGLETGKEGGGFQRPSLAKLKEAWTTPTEEAHTQFHEAPYMSGLTRFLSSAVTDPTTYLGGKGVAQLRSLTPGGKAFVERLAARQLTADVGRIAIEAEAAAKTGIRDSLWMPGQSGKVENGAKFLTPEALAKEGLPKASQVWKPYTPEGTAARIVKIGEMADAEPTVALTLGDALQLPRAQSLTYEYQAAREATLRTGGTAAERELESVQKELTWALREQTQTAPNRVPIGADGISMAEATRAFRNHEGYIVGGYDGIPAKFHYFDEIDDVVNRLGGYEPIRPRARTAEAVAQVGKAASEAAETEIIASVKSQPLGLKLSRLLSLGSSEKSWNTLTRAERVVILRGAGLDTAMATHRWKTLTVAADRAEIVRQMRNLAMGGGREASQIVTPAQAAAPAAKAAAQLVTPAQAAGEDALLKQALDIMREQAKIAKAVRPKLAQEYHLGRVTRAGRLREVGAQQLGEAGLAAKRQAAAGELAPGIKPFTGMDQVHRDAIINAIDRSETLLDWEKFNLQEGLIAQWDGVKFLQPAQLEKLQRAFGPEVAQAMLDIQKTGLTAGDIAKFGAMLPAEIGRGMMTGLTAVDLSASFRQGVVLAFTHPISGFAKPFWRQLKVVFSEANFKALDQARKLHPNYQFYTEDLKLGIRDMASSLSENQAEQYKGFISKFMEKYVPGVKQSQRAFVTFLNEQRFNVMDDWYQAYSRGGDVPIEQARGWARWVNWASGEGSIPEGGAAALTGLMWAPKLAVSRFQMPFAALLTNGVARRAILRDQLTFAGMVTSFLATAKMTGVADVELDPRSTEFGKMRIGNTRVDITGGQAVILRTFGQLVTGQRVDLQGGSYDANRWTIGGRFFQGKLQPGVGLLYDISQGHTFIGDELTMTGSSLKAQAFNRLVPLVIQDTVDAVQEWGPKGILFGGLSALGFGVQTYSTPWTTLVETKDAAAQKAGFKNFADMATQKGTNLALAMVAKDPEVTAAQERADAYRKAHGGFRPMAEIKTGFLAEQLADDAKLTASELTPTEWRDNRRARDAAATTAYKTFIDANPDLKKKIEKSTAKLGDVFNMQNPSVDDMTAAYFTLFDKYENANSGLIDGSSWDALDEDLARFRSQFTPEQLAKMEANMGTSKTDVERLYDANRKTVEATGWWEIPDNAWKMIQNNPQAVAEKLSTKTAPVTAEAAAYLSKTASGFASVDEYADAIYRAALQKTGSRIAAAEALTSDPILSKVIGGLTSDARNGILDKQPELAALVVGWGWKTDVINALLAKCLAAQGTTLSDVNQQLVAAGLTPIGSADDKDKAGAAYTAGAPVPPPITPTGIGAAPAPVSQMPAPVTGAPEPDVMTLQRMAFQQPGAGSAPTVPPVTPTGAEPPAIDATGGGTSEAATAAASAISANPVVSPTTKEAALPAGSREAVLQRLKGETPYPQAGLLDTVVAIASLGGLDLSQTPAGLPPDQLKAKLAAGNPAWATWVDDTTWQALSALGLQGKGNMLQTFWSIFNAGGNSILQKQIMKDEDVKRVLTNLQMYSSATPEMFLRAMNKMVGYFNGAVTGAQEDEAKRLASETEKLRKKEESAGKSAAKKAESAATKEADAAAEKERWARLAAELTGQPY